MSCLTTQQDLTLSPQHKKQQPVDASFSRDRRLTDQRGHVAILPHRPAAVAPSAIAFGPSVVRVHNCEIV